MLSTRWIKLLRDVQLTPGRIILMVIAIAAGVFGLATMFTSYVILDREIPINYLATNPASATIKLDRIDERLLSEVRAFPGIGAAQGSSTFHTSIVNDRSTPGAPQEIKIFANLDFSEKTISRIFPKEGAWPPPPDSLLLEQESLKQLQRKVGDSLTIDLGDGRSKTLLIAGTVHDPAMPTPSMSAFAYVSLATMRGLSDGKNPQNLQIIVSKKTLDAKHIEGVVTQLTGRLTQLGYQIERIQIPPPGEHPHQAIMQGVLIMLMCFSLLALLLSSVLSASIIEGLMAQQSRQMAVMKAIGASVSQIAVLYFTFIFMISALATAIAVPAGLAAGFALSKLVLLKILNFSLHSSALPIAPLSSLILTGILLPMLIAARSILAKTRVSVHSALSNFGTSQQHYSAVGNWKIIDKLTWINRSLIMSLRNCFRNRGRLILSLVLLSSAGAMFISSLNVKNASQQHLLNAATERHYQLEVISKMPQDQTKMRQLLQGIDGIQSIEAWPASRVARVGKSGIEIERSYPDGAHGTLTMVAMPVQSQLIDLPLTQGRKLTAEDLDAVILNQRALAFFPNTKVGDKIQISSFGKIKTLQLTGIAQQKMTGATAYISPATLATLATLSNQSELSRNYKIVSTQKRESEPELTALANTIRQVLKDHQIPVAAIVTETMLRTEVDGHFNLLILSLLFIALLMASVGALGLSATISNYVVERTREFGIMRSLGASRSTIMQNIIVEACMITAISYLLAVILALPLSAFIGQFVGELLMEEAFPLVVSWQSLALWCLITTFIGIAASAVPAWHSARLSIREALVFH